MEALRFDAPDLKALRLMDGPTWLETLAICDRTLMSLPLGDACAPALPDWVRKRLEENFRRVAQRADRTRDAFEEIVAQFEEAGLEYLVLKGYAKTPDF